MLGGDSYVYPIFESLGDRSSKFVLNHGGEEFPVYDLYLEIFDMRKFSGVNTRDPREFAKNMQRIQRSAFGPKMVTSMLNNLHPSDCYGYWMAVAQQRNRPVMSVVQARKVNGKWESATRVYEMDKHQTLLKEYASSGWETQAVWPTVNINGLGSFSFKVPRLSCNNEAAS